ncbi:MAG: hypothetical protein J6A28_04100, partial [Clostridia bacterium]|nr:hypothetical protein [Clostridia bacterium]
MTKTKTIVYITLYSFLICIAMTMGVFSLSFPEVSLYTNMYYYTDTSMMDKAKFWNAYMQFNEKAKVDGTPIVSEIYFDCYEDSSRKWYFFEEENQHVAISEENAIDVCMAEQYSISAYYYNYYSTKKATQVGAMLILS